MPVDKEYLPPSEEQQKKDLINDLRNEIEGLEQQCMRPLLEIHYLNEQGKDIQKEKAFLNQRYAKILQLRAQISKLESNT